MADRGGEPGGSERKDGGCRLHPAQARVWVIGAAPVLAGLLFVAAPWSASPGESGAPDPRKGSSAAAPEKDGRPPEPKPLVVIDFSKEQNVPEGSFAQYAEKKGWERTLGNPVHFSISGGALNLVARPGPVYRKRRWLAITDREQLRRGIENKVILRLTRDGFSVDLRRHPRIRFTMAPVELPGKGADLRNSSRNDSAFYLMLGLEGPTHDLGGVRIPTTLGYVWTDTTWRRNEVGRDPDYEKFLRYVAIGSGSKDLGVKRTICRELGKDIRRAYPEWKGKPLPRVNRIAVMIDSNTVDSTARSRLHAIEFLPAAPGKPVPIP